MKRKTTKTLRDGNGFRMKLVATFFLSAAFAFSGCLQQGHTLDDDQLSLEVPPIHFSDVESELAESAICNPLGDCHVSCYPGLNICLLCCDYIGGGSCCESWRMQPE
jgi:hypothetical protein